MSSFPTAFSKSIPSVTTVSVRALAGNRLKLGILENLRLFKAVGGVRKSKRDNVLVAVGHNGGKGINRL